MAGIINTAAVLNNGWNSGANDQVFSGVIAIDPMLEKNYDFALTSDPVQLQERETTQKNLYEIFSNSPYFTKYGGKTDDPSVCFTKKIERSEIIEIFYYTKERLEKMQKLSVMEMVMQIAEFYEIDYKYMFEQVLSVPLKAKLMRDIYQAGYKKEKIENTERLF